MRALVHYHVCHTQSHMSNAGANSFVSFTNLLSFNSAKYRHKDKSGWSSLRLTYVCEEICKNVHSSQIQFLFFNHGDS